MIPQREMHSSLVMTTIVGIDAYLSRSESNELQLVISTVPRSYFMITVMICAKRDERGILYDRKRSKVTFQ